MDNVEVKQSSINGKGLFTTKAYKKGDLAYTYSPERILKASEINELTPEQKLHLNKTREDEYELMGPPGCYVNHSCDPNIEEKDRNGYTLRDIEVGEELTVDYDKDAYLEKPFKCHCSAKNCRGWVRGR